MPLPNQSPRPDRIVALRLAPHVRFRVLKSDGHRAKVKDLSDGSVYILHESRFA